MNNVKHLAIMHATCWMTFQPNIKRDSDSFGRLFAHYNSFWISDLLFWMRSENTKPKQQHWYWWKKKIESAYVFTSDSMRIVTITRANSKRSKLNNSIHTTKCVKSVHCVKVNGIVAESNALLFIILKPTDYNEFTGCIVLLPSIVEWQTTKRCSSKWALTEQKPT